MPVIKKIDHMWYEIPGDVTGGAILVRYLNEGDRQEISQIAAPTRLTYAADGVKQESCIDRVLDRELTAVKSIVDWKGFYDGESTAEYPYGKPLPCTDDNKKLFSREDGFMLILKDARDKLQEIVDIQEKEAKKN